MRNSIRLAFILNIILFTIIFGQSKKSNLWDDKNFNGLEFRGGNCTSWCWYWNRYYFW